LGEANPFRYRSYYWDDETGLYYLQSRYYDPEVGRFVNADEPETMVLQGDSNILATNLFAYCFNNPIMNIDNSGMVVTPANVIGAVIGGIIGAVGGYFLTRWLADKIGLKGWKRNLFIAGLTAVITASAAAIGYFIGPYVAKAWATWSSRLAGLVRTSYRSIAKLTVKKMSHINVSKHLWGKVLKKVTNSGIESLIHQGIRHGTWNLLKNGTVQIVWKYKGQIIVITGKVIDKVLRISDAWVKK
jgi:RHS repeat-associated protein